MAKLKLCVQDMGDGLVQVELQGQETIDTGNPPTPAEALMETLTSVVDEIFGQLNSESERLH